MADSVKKQQGKTGKPGRPKGSTTKKETAGSSRAKNRTRYLQEEQFFQKGTGTGL